MHKPVYCMPDGSKLFGKEKYQQNGVFSTKQHHQTDLHNEYLKLGDLERRKLPK